MPDAKAASTVTTSWDDDSPSMGATEAAVTTHSRSCRCTCCEQNASAASFGAAARTEAAQTHAAASEGHQWVAVAAAPPSADASERAARASATNDTACDGVHCVDASHRAFKTSWRSSSGVRLGVVVVVVAVVVVTAVSEPRRLPGPEARPAHWASAPRAETVLLSATTRMDVSAGLVSGCRRRFMVVGKVHVVLGG